MRALQTFFLNKTTLVLDINKILYACKSTFDSIMNQTHKFKHKLADTAAILR